MATGEVVFNSDRMFNTHERFHKFEMPLLKAASVPVVGALPAAALVVVGLVHMVVGAIIWAACEEDHNDDAKRLFKHSCQVFGLACTFSFGTAVIQAFYMAMKEEDAPFWYVDHPANEP